MMTDDTIAESPAETRMAGILTAVREVFATKGFDKASMQDLARAAGMSAGNFYRYFPSKDAIIECLVSRDMAEIEQYFLLIMRSDDPVESLRAALYEQIDENDCEDCAIWVETMASARRKAGIARLYSGLDQTITDYLVTVFARIAGIPKDEAQRRYSAHAQMIFIVIQGIRLRRAEGDGFETSPLRQLARRTIDSILSEISPACAPDAALGTSAAKDRPHA